MQVSVSIEQRFVRTPDGATWTPAQFAYDFWSQYLEVFDGVRVLARVLPVAAAPAEYQRVDGPCVRVAGLPHYLGPRQYLAQRKRLLAAVREEVRGEGAYILRVSSQIANVVQPRLQARRYPYAVEVVGDPYDVFAPGSFHSPLAPLCRRILTQRLRQQCAHAAAAAYVTEHTLQKRYPCANGMFAFSDVQLPDSAIAAAPRPCRLQTSYLLLFVGTFTQMYKGPDIAINAAAQCVREGWDIGLVMIGDGQYRAAMERLAREAGLGSRITFTGQLPPEEVRRFLDRADLFLLPSRTEGLPRAVLEAMARGLPCLASRVGGIPELLLEEDLVAPGSAPALAAAIGAALRAPGRRAAMARRNLERAKRYRLAAMREKRREFLRTLRSRTEQGAVPPRSAEPCPCRPTASCRRTASKEPS